MIKTKRVKKGPVGVKPEGDWRNDVKYPLLREVQHNHDSWISKVNDNIGHEPVDDSPYWFRSTKGGQYAHEAGEAAELQGDIAEAKGNMAQSQGNTAESKGNVAEGQGLYAEEQGNRCKTMADHRDKLGADGYIYTYDPENDKADADGYVKTDQYINATLDISKLTPQQQKELMDKFVLDYATEEECRGIVTNYNA